MLPAAVVMFSSSPILGFLFLYLITSILMSIKLLLIHSISIYISCYVREKKANKILTHTCVCAACVYLPKFSTSQGNVKVSPTTALYVCPCVLNLACDVDDVVASDLLPTKK